MATRKTLRERAKDLGDTLAPHVGSARDKAVAVSEDARVKATPYLTDARDKAIAASADVRDKATPLISDARDKAIAASADARDKATPYLSDARDKTAPYLSEVRDRAQPLLSEVRDRFNDDVLPVVTAAVSAVDDATEDVRSEAVKRGRAVAAAVKGEVDEPKRSHTVRNVLVALGLGGVVFAVVRRLGDRQPSTTWQSAYEPPPAGGLVDTAAEEAAADPAASDPAEFAADVAGEPHAVTTPDDPATEIDVDKR